MKLDEYKGKVFQNYNRQIRWRGIIDYKSLIAIIVYMFVVWMIMGIFNTSIQNKLYILIIFTIPVFSLTVMYMSEESVVDMAITVLKYIVSTKKYAHILGDRQNEIVLSQDTKIRFEKLNKRNLS